MRTRRPFVPRRPGAPLRLAAGLLVAGLLTAVPVAAQAPVQPGDAPAPITREYLHQQPPATALVFRFETFEAEFESRVAEAGQAPFRISGVPGLRLGPLFQFVEPVTKPRQLVIDAAMGRRSTRARIDMEVVRFDPAGPDQEWLQQAYRLLSHGLETAPPERADLWQQKVMSLKQAVTLFDRLGMQDPTLWAEFYAAHFLLERLGDALTAAEDARRLQQLAARSRQSRVLLAALQLEGRALLALAQSSAGDAAFDRARQVFERAARHAAELDFQHERALALFYIGLADERQARHDRAFARWADALEVTALNGDVDFANAIRRHAAALHERLGQTDAAITMMQRIETPGTAAAAPSPDVPPPSTPEPTQRDAVRYLYEQGRLLEKAHRHEEAIAVLREALALAGESPAGSAAGPIGLLLGQALFGAGRFEEAATRLVDAIPRTAASAHAGDLLRAWDILATIRRARGEHDAVAASREQQAKFVTTPADRARLDYQLGVDAAARGDAVSARQAFREAARGAAVAGLADLALLSRLRRCTVEAGGCDALGERLSGTAASVDAFEAGWVELQILKRQDRSADAATAAERLLTDVLRHRSATPGQLGAWYWLRRDALFDDYLQLRMRAAGTGPDTALATLAALEAVRATAEEPAAADLEGLAESLRARIDRLPADTSLVAWHLSGDHAVAWIGRRGGLRLAPLRWNAGLTGEVASRVEALRIAAADGLPIDTQLDRLGALLLDPVANGLDDIVLFLPLGPLQGLPLDALTVDGEPLLRRHRVVNLVSLDGLDEVTPELDITGRLPVFLAGNRQQGAGDFTVPTTPSSELGVVAERFIGPNLALVRGAALQWDEFQDRRFADARLLHLAMPAIEDLADPPAARLVMSDSADPEWLEPLAAVLPGPLAAGLAVLSRVEFAGRAQSALAPRGGLVGTLLDRGAGAVVVSLWPVGDEIGAIFMRRFYTELAETPDIGRALTAAKRALLEERATGSGGDASAWAAFQLFVD